jgi:translation initiation factor IF-2
MGHVDHGARRAAARPCIFGQSANATGELAHHSSNIGAYQVEWQGHLHRHTGPQSLYGHAPVVPAFLIDIVVLVVRADDGVMPTTVCAIAISHAGTLPTSQSSWPSPRSTVMRLTPNRVLQQLP